MRKLFLAIAFVPTLTYAADYREEQATSQGSLSPSAGYQEGYQPQPAQTPTYAHKEETIITGGAQPLPPPPPQVVYVQPRPRAWNPIGAIMAVPRAALRVPGAILGGDDDE